MLLDALDAGSWTRKSAGYAVPAFVLPDPDGHQITVDPAEHAATVLVFTSNACPYALAWHDRLQQVARDYAGRGVQVAQIVSNDDRLQPADSVDNMRARERAGEIAGRYLKDSEQAIARLFGATATPEVYVVDQRGVIRYHGVPDGDYDDPAQNARFVRDALDSVLSGQPVAVPETSPAGCSLKWRVELLWWDGCPTHEEAGRLLEATLDEMCRSDGRISPLPTGDQLRERLRAALARPWDLPGWTDIRRTSADHKGVS